MPSGLQMPDTTPSADSCASRLPDISSIGGRQMRSRVARRIPRRSCASRQAAVASTQISLTSIVSQSARKRASAASAFSMASAASSPVVGTSRPSPHSTFSLKIGVGDRVRPS